MKKSKSTKARLVKPFSAKRKMTSADIHFLTNILGSGKPDKGFKVSITHNGGNKINLPLDEVGAQKLNDLVTTHIATPGSGWFKSNNNKCDDGCLSYTDRSTGQVWCQC